MSKKISQLTTSTTPTSGDIVPLANSAGATVGIQLRHIKNYFDNDAGLNRNRGISGDLRVSGNTTISGSFNASGSSILGRNSLSTTTVIGTLNQSGNLIVSGSAIISGDFTATGNNILLGNGANSFVYISGLLTSAGGSVFKGNQAVHGTLTAVNAFIVSGSGIFGTSGQSQRQHTFYGKTLFDQTGFFLSGLFVNGSITGDNLYISSDVELRGTSSLYGNTTIGTNSTNALIVPATSLFFAVTTFSSNVEIQGGLNLFGTFSTSGLNIFGNSNADTSIFHGDLISRNTLTAWSGILVSGGLRSSGNIVSLGSGIFATGVSINGPLTASGKAWLGRSISESTFIQGTGFVSGSIFTSQNLGVSGDINCAGTIYSNQVKQGFFDPQVKIGLQNGICFDSGIGVQKIRFQFYKGPTNRVLWPNTGEFQTNDVIYVSGVKGGATASDDQQDRMAAYNGFYIIDSTYATTTEGGLLLRPTGLPMWPPATAGNNSGSVPYILCHYRSGWLRGISGVIPMRGSADLTDERGEEGSLLFHHKVIFNQPFVSSDYMVQLTCNQGSGQNTTEEHLTTRLKGVNVSYMDNNLATEKIVYAGMPGTGSSHHNLNGYAEKEYYGTMPTRVWARFETI